MTVAVVTASSDWTLRLQQWEYALCNFKPDALYIDGETDRWSPHVSARPIPPILDLPGELVVLAPLTGRHVVGEVSLCEFKHPENATYWFGSDSANLDPDRFINRQPDHIVYIPTDTNDQMYSWVSYAVVMWDRRLKLLGGA